MLDERQRASGKPLQQVRPELLGVGTFRLPPIPALDVFDLHQPADVDGRARRLEEGAQQHAPPPEMHRSALEMRLEPLRPRREPESVGHARVGRRPPRLDVREARHAVDAVAAHEEVARSGGAVGEGQAHFGRGFGDLGRLLAAVQLDVGVGFDGCQHGFEGVAARDAECLRGFFFKTKMIKLENEPLALWFDLVFLTGGGGLLLPCMEGFPALRHSRHGTTSRRVCRCTDRRTRPR